MEKECCGFSLSPLKGYLLHPKFEAAPEGAACSPPAAGRSWNMCVLLSLAASDADSSCRGCIQAPVTMLTSAPQFPAPQTSAKTFPSPSARGSALPANLGAGADRVGLWMPGWWAGWRPPQPSCLARTPWSPGSSPVRSRGDLQAGPVCAAGCPVGSGEKAGARQSAAREAVYSQRNGILRPRSLRRLPGRRSLPRAHGWGLPGTCSLALSSSAARDGTRDEVLPQRC